MAEANIAQAMYFADKYLNVQQVCVPEPCIRDSLCLPNHSERTAFHFIT